METIEYFFHFIELAAFIIPAIPNNITTRLAILGIYFIGHYLKLQIPYKTFKKKWIEKSEQEKSEQTEEGRSPE